MDILLINWPVFFIIIEIREDRTRDIGQSEVEFGDMTSNSISDLAILVFVVSALTYVKFWLNPSQIKL